MDGLKSKDTLILMLLLLVKATDSFPKISASQAGNEGHVKIQVRGLHNLNQSESSGAIFPEQLEIAFNVNEENLVFGLLINRGTTSEIHAYVNRLDTVLSQYGKNYEEVAFYEDPDNGSMFMAWCQTDTKPDNNRGLLFYGTFTLKGVSYLVKPLEDTDEYYTVTKVPSTLASYTDIINLLDTGNDKGKAERSPFKTKPSHRLKRQTTEYEIELLFVIDYSVYLFWYNRSSGSEAEREQMAQNSIRQFYSFVLDAMNVRFESLTGVSYSITCLHAGIYIADEASAAPFVEDNLVQNVGSDGIEIDIATVLAAFRDWANTNMAPDVSYDHAILFTKYNIGDVASPSSFQIASAYWEGLCGNNRYSIVEDNFQPRMVTAATRQLSRNMGAAADGSGNNCGSSDGYIMAPTTTTSASDVEFNRRQYRFSTCTHEYFSAFIATLDGQGNNCMTSRSPDYNATALAAYENDMAGQVYPPDEQCEVIIGEGSFLTRAVYDFNYTEICAYLACAQPGNTDVFTIFLALEGTSCDDGKICRGGNCVTSDNAVSDVDETCLFGDTPYDVPSQSVDCTELLGTAQTSYQCYSSSNRMSCCATCAVHQQNNAHRTGCEYGDRHVGCAGLSLSGCYSNEATCCQSCPDNALGIPDCPYGDRASGCNVNNCASYSESTRALCCETCAFCVLPIVSNGNVRCMDAAGDVITGTPEHSEVCVLSCDSGLAPNYDNTTCSVSAGIGSFDNDLDCVACEARYDHCSACDGTVCTSCDAGFVLTSAGDQCLSCSSITNCISCPDNTNNDDNVICASCAGDYILSADERSCLTCEARYDHCAACDGAVCTSCDADFVLTSAGDQCLSCSSISNCISCPNNTDDDDNVICASCAADHILSADERSCLTCVERYTNCVECDGGVCTSCDTDFALFSGGDECLACSDVSNCVACEEETDDSDNAICTSCADGYEPAADGLSCVEDTGDDKSAGSKAQRSGVGSSGAITGSAIAGVAALALLTTAVVYAVLRYKKAKRVGATVTKTPVTTEKQPVIEKPIAKATADTALQSRPPTATTTKFDFNKLRPKTGTRRHGVLPPIQ